MRLEAEPVQVGVHLDVDPRGRLPLTGRRAQMPRELLGAPDRELDIQGERLLDCIGRDRSHHDKRSGYPPTAQCHSLLEGEDAEPGRKGLHGCGGRQQAVSVGVGLYDESRAVRADEVAEQAGVVVQRAQGDR